MRKGLKGYAKLIAKVGANVKKGEECWIYADLDQPEFVSLVVEECYKLGAKKVRVLWNYPEITKIASNYETLEEMSRLTNYMEAELDYQSSELPIRIYLISDDPDALKGADQDKLSKARMNKYPLIKKYIDKAEDKYKWVIAAVPGIGWAKKVFPNLTSKQAVNKLWDAILYTSRAYGNGVKNWKEHNKFLEEQCKKLNDLHLVRMEYKGDNGTDFKADLIPDALFVGGGEYTLSKKFYNPNIPSEECFTSPMKGRAEGRLVATKPLSYNGELIDGFYLDFKDGKVVNVHADKNEELLKKMVKMDEGASMLGELALVPVDSPISNSNILFYNTLFDENAACHVALGRGFGSVIKDFGKYTQEELERKGINSSMIHVDFMIGYEGLDIDGITDKGERIAIFRKGNWAI